MQIEISAQASAKIAAAIGAADPQTIHRLVERMAEDSQLMQSLMSGSTTPADLQAVQHGLDSWNAGNVRPFAEFDAEFRQQNQLPPR